MSKIISYKLLSDNFFSRRRTLTFNLFYECAEQNKFIALNYDQIKLIINNILKAIRDRPSPEVMYLL